jgi:hypothetical protein
MDLTVLFEPKLDLAHVAAVLDELGHSGRLDTIRAWEKKELSALYDAAAGFHPIDLHHFVPTSVGPMTEVIHHGKNSLTLGSHFQHRICRPAPSKTGESHELWGYNHQDFALWTGPGYFVVHEAEAPGEVAIDYTQTPTGLGPASGGPPNEPSGWPQVVPSSARLGRFVFRGTIDIVRGISKHVVVGRVRRGKNWMDVWFALCREDAG